MAAPAPRGAWENPSATWRLGGSNARGRPQRHLASRSWQKVGLAMAAQPPRGARVDQAPRGASHCYYNNIIYIKTDNIFSIHTINYK